MMSMPCNEETYNRLINEDIEWLKDQFKDSDENDSLELRHAIDVLEYSKKTYAKYTLPSMPNSAWNC